MKNIVKVILIIVVLCGLGFLGYFIYSNSSGVKKVAVEEEKALIDEYYIYGNHFNMTGSLTISDMNYQDVSLSLYGEEEKIIPIISENDGNKIDFYLSEHINDGLFLDDLARGKYYLFLKLQYVDEEDKEIFKYYVLDNKTEYKEATYYTLSKYDNQILIDSNNDYQTMAFDISKNNNKKVYDVTIDPGHGGMDGGGSSGSYKESDFTMIISSKIREYLEADNIKVKFTHEKGDLTTNDLLDEYGTHGRAVIPNEVKSKYTFSIHINKNTYGGVKGFEIYTADNIDYDLAKSLAENLEKNTDLSYSTNKLYRVFNGIYTRNFTESEIESSNEEYESKGYKPFNITTKSNYYYMVRETGGFMTGAYVSDINDAKVGSNPYYNSNVANESYLLELCYLSNDSDLQILVNNPDSIAKAVADTIVKEIYK